MKIAGIIGCIFLAFACNNSKEEKNVTGNSLPGCIRKQIASIEDKTEKYPPIMISEYEYKGKRVFLYTADCCDQYDQVVDEDCKTLCAPAGGLDGMGDGRCTDFDSTAKKIKVIWQKKEE